MQAEHTKVLRERSTSVSRKSAIDFASPREGMKTLEGDEPSRLARPTSRSMHHVHIDKRREDRGQRQPARTGLPACADWDSSLSRHGHPKVND